MHLIQILEFIAEFTRLRTLGYNEHSVIANKKIQSQLTILLHNPLITNPGYSEQIW